MNQNGNFGGEENNIPGQHTAVKKKPYTVSLPITILLIVLAALLTFQTTFVTLTVKHKMELTAAKAAMGKFQILEEAYKLFGEEYIYDIDIEQLIDDMLRAFNAQDQYSAYYTFEDYLRMMAESRGSAKGIGVYVSGTQTSVFVTYVIPGAPAETAGIKAGDEILAVNGIYVKDIGYNAALNMVSGENGTQVMLKILRDGKEMDIGIIRGDYIPYTVIHSVMEEKGEKIGYVKIIQFDTITVSQFKTAMEDLKTKGCEKFIFDLRSNPGGELGSVVSILDYLLPKGPIVHILDGDKNVTEVYESDENEVTGEMIVLINGRTASAGELFTSALRDYNKATLIGTKTYGKGCGQRFHQLSNGSLILITSFFYNPPFGENYDGVGIYPDIEVELPDEYKNKNTLVIPLESDTQLSAALSELTK
jgi:carboxyl-terminal processing protease